MIFVKLNRKDYRGFLKSMVRREFERYLYGKAQWFMADEKTRRTKSISTMSSDYDWVTESLKAEADWN